MDNHASTTPSPPDPGATDATADYRSGVAGEELVRILDQYLADLEAGRAPSREKLLAEHPGLASQLEPCLSGIEFIHRAARPAADAPSRLGDFEIVGEVGRGGMGVVYEARQLSLKRKVALKVLRFAGVADRDAMERFQREAETVAQLHHTNIVPIFAIGEQQGVFYYAMQFIEGRSLAAVLEQSQRAAAPLNLVEAARWALQAAEALAYAHQRGVIHRDVKPSNLILDPAGQVWLTDFGLAKRMDDVELSMTGALLGTPRYMSPEQASAAKQPVDQRTDIYSLGATLYELATGKPLFEADSPHGIISQILTAEPPSPRSQRASLPRDLETIILKCLAKEPQQRYATAQALADDLRAFCDGRAIKARRAGLPERAVRWVRKNRRSVLLAASAAAIGMVLVVGGLLLSSQLYQSRLGRVSFKTEGPNLVAEVLEADQDRAVLPPFTVPTTEPVALPAGSYRVRLSAPRRAAETSQLLVDSGSQLDLSVGLKQQLLWDPVSLNSSDTVRVVKLKPGGWYMIHSHWDKTLSLLDGVSAQSVWQWSSTGDLAGRSLAYDRDQDPPELVRPAPDLDGDGVGDLVWACRKSAALWAISGAAKADKKGKELWWFSAGAGETLGVPAVADVDGDGTADFIATFAAKGNVWDEALSDKTLVHYVQAGATRLGGVWIEAVSGKTGKSLWRFPLEDKWVRDATRPHFAPQVAQLNGRPTVICVAGTRLVGLDVKTGKSLWPAVDLGMYPIVRPQVADLDHDGQPDVLLVGLEANDTLSLLALSLATQKPIWKKALRGQVPPVPWNWDGNDHRSLRALRAWPWVVELDDSHRPEVIVPMIPANGGNYFYGWGGVELLDGATGALRWQHRLRLQNDVLCCDRLLVGPDIDGDGRRDLFAASTACYSGRQAVFVDALSGKDGRSLWWWRSDESMGYFGGGGNSSAGDGFSSNFFGSHPFQTTSLRLWSTGPDGWPQLVVPYSSGETAVLSAGSGRLQQKILDNGLVQTADLDGDGIDDLVFRDFGVGNLYTIRGTAPKGPWSANSWAPTVGNLYAIRGTPPEMWRRLGDWRPAEDFDGDGTPDLLNRQNSGSWGRTAISGRDGHVLWRFSEPALRHVALPPAHNDLDGDGTPDFLALGYGGVINATSHEIRLPIDLHAISGRTGKRIWSAEDVVVGPENGQSSAPNVQNTQVLACPDLKGDGQLAVVLSYDMNYQASTHQLWLAALSLRDGKTLWRQAVSERLVDPGHFFSICCAPGIADLDGDGVLDLVIAVPAPPEKAGGPLGYELRALSGRDGKLLWRRPLPLQMWENNNNVRNAVSVPAIGNLGGDATPQVVVLTQSAPRPEHENVAQVLSFDGRTGEPLWKHQPKFRYSQEYEPHVLLVDPEGNGKLEVYAALRLAPYRYDGVKRTRVFYHYNGVGFDPDWCDNFATSNYSLSDTDPFFHPDDSVCLDFRGQVRPALEMPIAATFDLDGKEALVLLRNGKLRVTRGGTKNTLWERSGIGDFRQVLPGKSGQPATVVVRSGDSLLGLNGATGQALWRCPLRDAESILAAQDPHEPPWLISHADGSTICRRALATTAGGEYAPAVGAPRTDRPLPDDPRIVRPLPWVLAHQVLVESDSLHWMNPEPQLIALAVLRVSGWLFLLTLLVGAVRRRWRSVAAWLAVFLVATALIAILSLWGDARAMGPMEHYSLSSWYQVGYFGISAAGALLVLWFIVRLLWRLGRWCVGRILARARAA